MWSLGLTLAISLTLKFQGQTWILLYLTQKWSDYHEAKIKHIDWTLGLSNVTIRFDLGHDIDLEFSRLDIKSAIPQPKMVRLPRNEKQTYRLDSRPQMWPWNVTLAMTLNFQGQIWICYIWAKNGLIAMKWKANIWIKLWASNVTNGFDLRHDIDLEFSRSDIEFAISQPKMVWLSWNEKQTYWLHSRPQMWPSSHRMG